MILDEIDIEGHLELKSIVMVGSCNEFIFNDSLAKYPTLPKQYEFREDVDYMDGMISKSRGI